MHGVTTRKKSYECSTIRVTRSVRIPTLTTKMKIADAKLDYVINRSDVHLSARREFVSLHGVYGVG